MSPVLNSEQNGRQTELPEQAAMLRSLKRGLHIYWARREECEVFFCKEMSQESLFPDFLAVHAPLIILRRQTLNHSVDTRSCSVQWSFENRVTTRIKKKRGMIMEKLGTVYLLRNQHILELEPHYGWLTVHNCLLNALFLPHLMSFSIKVTEHQISSLPSSALSMGRSPLCTAHLGPWNKPGERPVLLEGCDLRTGV